MSSLEYWELASYIVTVIGLPFAILVYIYDNRKERQNEEEELHQRLADEYMHFLKLVLDNADLQLLSRQRSDKALTDEDRERKKAIFGILVSIFERAYILVYEDHMPKQTRRLWLSWEDYMREWCRREDFRAALPIELEGEDEDFRKHIMRIFEEEGRKLK